MDPLTAVVLEGFGAVIFCLGFAYISNRRQQQADEHYSTLQNHFNNTLAGVLNTVGTLDYSARVINPEGMDVRTNGEPRHQHFPTQRVPEGFPPVPHRSADTR